MSGKWRPPCTQTMDKVSELPQIAHVASAVEPKPSNNELIARRSVSRSEELGRQLAPLVTL